MSIALKDEAMRILATAGAIVLGFVILVVGGSVSGALMVANLKLAPRLPLFG